MKLWVAGLSLVMMMGSGLVGDAVAQSDLNRVVKERREGLKAAQANMDAVAAVARSGGDPRTVVDRIVAVQTFFAGFGTRFPPGSGQGSPGIDSRALPAIWTDRAGYDRAEAALGPQLAALRASAESGNVPSFQAALQAAGAACVDCHRPYRAR